MYTLSIALCLISCVSCSKSVKGQQLEARSTLPLFNGADSKKREEDQDYFSLKRWWKNGNWWNDCAIILSNTCVKIFTAAAPRERVHHQLSVAEVGLPVRSVEPMLHEDHRITEAEGAASKCICLNGQVIPWVSPSGVWRWCFRWETSTYWCWRSN